MLYTRQPVPALRVSLLDGGEYDLAAEKPENFSLVVFYRGWHCPICGRYLQELEKLVGDFADRGVLTVAISSDTVERARNMAEKVKAEKLRFGYGLSLAKAREWDLVISTGRGKTSIDIEEPELFAEPGVFLVRADGTLYWRMVQTMPFARPHFSELLGAVDFVLKNSYPARGEYTGAV